MRRTLAIALIASLAFFLAIPAQPAAAHFCLPPIGCSPHITVSGGSVVEGDTGTATISFTITKFPGSGSLNFPVFVFWTTLDGTARSTDLITGPKDYMATSGSHFFPSSPFVATHVVLVTVFGDKWDEATEFFSLFRSGGFDPSTLTVGTIVTDDPAAPAGLNHDVGVAGGGFRTKGHIDISRNGTGPYDVTIKVKNSNGHNGWPEDIAYRVVSSEPVVMSPTCGIGYLQDVAPGAEQVVSCTVTYAGGPGDPDPTLTLEVFHNGGDGGTDSDATNNTKSQDIVLNP